MRVAFQGERGAYSEEALLQRYPEAQPVPSHALDDVFEGVATGEVDAAVVPVENSQAGSIARTYDLLRQHDLFITGEIILPIEHCLMALPGQALSDITRVHSHPSALAQCQAFLDEHAMEPVAEPDTAGSARTVAEDDLVGEGALAGHQAAVDHGLEILAEDVATTPHNRTRFVVLEREAADRGPGEHKTSLVFATDHRAGALYQALTPLAEHEVNMLKLESRPSRGRPWEYVFHLDVEGHRDDEHLRQALSQLGRVTTFVKVLGSYPMADEPLVG